MSLPKSVLAGIFLSISGLAVCVAGVAIGVPEIKEIKENMKNVEKSKYEFNAKDLNLSLCAGNVTIQTTTEDKSYIDYSITPGYEFVATDNSFTVTSKKGNWFYNLFGIYNVMDVYISEADIENVNLQLTMNAGELTTKSAMTLNTIKLELNAGDVNLDNVTANSIDMTVSAGNIDMDNAKIKDIQFEVNAGNVDLNVLYPEDYYTISISTNLGNASVSPKNKHNQTGSEADYKVSGTVNCGNIDIDFKN